LRARTSNAGQAIGIRRRLTDLVILIRPPSCLAGGASVVLGVHLATGRISLAHYHIIPAIAAMILAVAAANVFNDVLDISLDALAKPSRPLPSGRFSLQSALSLAGSLAVAAITAAIPLGIYALVWMVGLLAVAAAYSLRLKNTVLLGNITVALCASSPILFGAAAAGRFDVAVFIAAGLAFAFMFTYETLKTIADRDSDTAGGIRTFAAVRGAHAALVLFRFLIMALTAAALAAASAAARPVLDLTAVFFTFMLPAWSATMVLGRHPAGLAIGRSVFLMRIAWFLGIIALWLLR
jgi:geranylgeranylglycerol-phosphate geranylgeranyltransferase